MNTIDYRARSALVPVFVACAAVACCGGPANVSPGRGRPATAVCRACGVGGGQPCGPAPHGVAAATRRTCAGASLACGDQGLCTTCGQPGQVCCENSPCIDGGCCQANSNTVSTQVGYCIASGTQ